MTKERKIDPKTIIMPSINKSFLRAMDNVKDSYLPENRAKYKKPIQIHYMKIEMMPDMYYSSGHDMRFIDFKIETDREKFSFRQTIDICDFESTFSMLMDRAKHTIERLVKEHQEGEDK